MVSGWQAGGFSGTGCQHPSPALSPPASPCSSQGQAVHVVDLIREVLLPLLSQQAEACTADDGVDHLEVPAHAAVHVVQDHALLGHVVFDDDDAIGAQALFAAPQELSQVLVGQVAWGRQRRGCWEEVSAHMPPGVLATTG